jgi:CHASE2 domain-containing sensor protein
MIRFWQGINTNVNQRWLEALPGLVVIVGVTVARLAGTLQFLELVTLDKFLRWRPPEPADQRIVIVGLTEADIQRVGTYPIPDRTIAELLQQLQTYQPTVIGLDIVRDIPVEPGYTVLKSLFRSYKNVIGVEIALPDRSGFTVAPPPALPAAQIGFADAVLDADVDGFQRRSLLGTHTQQGTYRFSFTMQVARQYLAAHGIELENGIRDLEAMRFGRVELTRVQPNFGGYVRTDAGGNQILLNVRSGKEPFRRLSLAQIRSRQVPAGWLREKIVLIGVTSQSAKDLTNSGAIAGIRPGQVYGVEMQAHAISQIISAVLDQRPLLQVWGIGWELAWIVAWGLLGMILGRLVRSPWKLLFGLVILCSSFIGIGYGLIILGWWVPIVPVLLILVLNGTGLLGAIFYRKGQELQLRLEERQFVIELIFNAIHRGPMQTLTQILRNVNEQDIPPAFLSDLQHLREDLRAIYEAVQEETSEPERYLPLGGEIKLALQAPLHDLLYQVYHNTLKEDLPHFKTIKSKIVQFDPLDTRYLRPQHRRGLCRFLEEALINVGKYATGATRLIVICTQEGNQQLIRVVDNGKVPEQTKSQNSAVKGSHSGLGTRLASDLAKQLRGKFRRYDNSPTGTICELTWLIKRRWFWR